MANNKKSANSKNKITIRPKSTAPNPQKQKRNTIIVISVISVIAIAAIVGLCVYALSQDTIAEDGRYDYLKSNSEKYVSIEESLYKSPSVTLPSYLNGDENAVQKYIEFLCKENEVSTGNKITDQPIKEGDTVAIYYEGWKDGEKFSGGSNMDDKTPYSLKIGSGTFIPGFEEGLIGLIPANTSKDNLYELHLTFPENYHSTDLAGKAVVFKVYVEYIDEKVPAEYTDKFITSTLGYTTKESDVKAAFEKYLKDEYLPSLKESETSNAIWNALTENAKVKGYPEGEVEYIYDSYKAQYEQYYTQYYSKTYSSFEVFMTAYYGSNWKTSIEDISKDDVAKNLIYHYIAQKENIQITDEDYNNAVNYYIQYYASQGEQLTASDIENYFGERGINEYVIAEKVNKLLLQNCTVSYE